MPFKLTGFLKIYKIVPGQVGRKTKALAHPLKKN